MERKWFKSEELVTNVLSAAKFQTFANARLQGNHPVPQLHFPFHFTETEDNTLRRLETSAISMHCAMFHMETSFVMMLKYVHTILKEWDESECSHSRKQILNRTRNLYVEIYVSYKYTLLQYMYAYLSK